VGHISAYESATILPFVRRHDTEYGLSIGDRIAARRWAEAARPHGVRAVRIHDPEPGDDPALGSFILIYRDDALWAAWGVSVTCGCYEVWRASSGATIGQFTTLSAALAVIRAVA
jgi:hypothetical protein